MKITDFGLKWNPIVDKIRSVAVENNLTAYISGGFVRDLFLKKSPKDLDIMVDIDGGGIKLAELVYAKFGGHVPVIFPRFGTAKISVDGENIEFVASRKEFYHDNNRKPDVEFASAFADVLRRDFSMNALLLRLNDYEILDYTGNGIKDIENKIIRVTDESNPDIIMIQDPLRMLRAVRQSAQHDFFIESNTSLAIKRNAQKLTTISKERIQEELNKMLMTDNPSRAFILLKEHGLLKYISTLLDNLQSSENEEDDSDNKNVWEHTLKVLDYSPKILIVRLGALFHDIAKPETKQYSTEEGKRSVSFTNHEHVGTLRTKEILHDLRYSDEIIKAVMILVKNHMRGHAYDEGNNDNWTDSAVRRYVLESQPYTNELLDLTMADITPKTDGKRQLKVEKIKKLKERIKLLNEQDEISKLRSPLNGFDLMEIYGKKAGPWLKEINEFLLEKVLSGELKKDDKIKALEILKKENIQGINNLP
jgi:putative nucleotidyltransferase with HDIG domain